jgi:AhpD family alkylhydroperoxidase
MSDEVVITNHRVDATQNESLIGMARMGADAFGYTAELRIDRGLAQLLRLRVSQLNNCSYCLNLHYEAARDVGIPRAKIDTLTAWWEADLHSEAEQAALRYTEALTRASDTDAGQAFQRFHDGLAKHFDAEKILEIIGVVVKIVFAVIVVEESNLPHEHLIVLAIYLTMGLSVLAHGLSAAPLANRYVRWYEQHPRDKAPPMESAPTDVTRSRGPVAQPAELT